MKFVVSGDWHLRPQIWSNRPLYNDTYFAAAQVVTYCLKNELDLVLTGDQFDTPRPPSGALAFFQECASVLHDAGLNCYALPGNHDSCDPEWTDVVSHVTSLKNKRVVINNDLTFQGVGHSSFSDLKMKLEQLDVTGVDVLVMHQLLDLACPLESMHNLKAEWLPRVPAVVMGDLHDPTSIITPDGVRVIYPGPPVGMTMSEAIRETGFCVADAPESGKPIAFTAEETTHRLVVSNRFYRQLEIKDLTDFHEFKNFMLTNTSNCFLGMVGERWRQLQQAEDAMSKVIPDKFGYLKQKAECSSICRPVVQVKFDPDVVSLNEINKILAKTDEILGSDVCPPYLFAVPFRPDNKRKQDIEESIVEDFDPTSPETVRPLVNQLVKIEGLLSDAGDLLVDLIQQGESPDPEDRRMVISRWRSRYGLDESPESS